MILEGMKKWVGRVRAEEREREREAVGGLKGVNNGGFLLSFSGDSEDWVVVGSNSIDEFLEV